PVLLAAQDVPVQRLLGLHPRGGVPGLLLVLGALGLEVLDEPLERVLAAVEHQVVGQLPLRVGDLGIGRDVVGVDKGQVQSRLRLATSTLRSAVLAIPSSSMVSAISAAPWAVASGTTWSSLSRPASRLIELTIARPGICSSAVRMTSGSVESTWMGAGWVSEMR